MGEPYLFLVRAIADYSPATDSEIGIKCGEIYEIYEVDDRNIWFQSFSDGKYGWFPASFAERINTGDLSHNNDNVVQNTDIIPNDIENQEQILPSELEQTEENQDSIVQEEFAQYNENQNELQESSLSSDISSLHVSEFETPKQEETIHSTQTLPEINDSSVELNNEIISNNSIENNTLPQTTLIEPEMVEQKQEQTPHVENINKETTLTVDVPLTPTEPLIHSSSPTLSRSLSKSGGKKSLKKYPSRRASTTDALKKPKKKKVVRKRKKGKRPTPSLITEEKNKKCLPCTLHIQIIEAKNVKPIKSDTSKLKLSAHLFFKDNFTNEERKIGSTDTIKRNLTPRWSHLFKCVVKDAETESAVIRLCEGNSYDKKKVIGECQVPLRGSYRTFDTPNFIVKWFPMKTLLSDNETARIRLCLEYFDSRQTSAPENFVHVGHIGWSNESGFSADNIPEEWKEIFKEVGITKGQLRNKEFANTVFDILKRYDPHAPAPQAPAPQAPAPQVPAPEVPQAPAPEVSPVPEVPLQLPTSESQTAPSNNEIETPQSTLDINTLNSQDQGETTTIEVNNVIEYNETSNNNLEQLNDNLNEQRIENEDKEDTIPLNLPSTLPLPTTLSPRENIERTDYMEENKSLLEELSNSPSLTTILSSSPSIHTPLPQLKPLSQISEPQDEPITSDNIAETLRNAMSRFRIGIEGDSDEDWSSDEEEEEEEEE